MGYRVTRDEEAVDAHDPVITPTRRIKQHIGAEGEDYNVQYKKTYGNSVVNRRETTLFDKILDEIKDRADDIKAELEAYQTKEGNYNPEDYPIEAVYEETKE